MWTTRAGSSCNVKRAMAAVVGARRRAAGVQDVPSRPWRNSSAATPPPHEKPITMLTERCRMSNAARCVPTRTAPRTSPATQSRAQTAAAMSTAPVASIKAAAENRAFELSQLQSHGASPRSATSSTQKGSTHQLTPTGGIGISGSTKVQRSRKRHLSKLSGPGDHPPSTSTVIDSCSPTDCRSCSAAS